MQLLIQLAVAQPSVDIATANEAFQQTWARTDQPVATGQANRTWMWGPEAFTEAMTEAYEPAGLDITERTVQYFDKSRMEITNPNGDPSSIWYVTNGLLVRELMTGEMQVGDEKWVTRFPAEVNVAGDSDDPDGPTYATFAELAYPAFIVPSDEGETITQRIDREGTITDDSDLTAHGVTTARYVPDTGHHVASVFWAFMEAEGVIYEGGTYATGALFPNPFYATGFPITEPYWATVRVGNTPRDVLMQCFERRCLTFTPDNPEGWQVEAGNVGQHYYTWRYETEDPPPVEEPEEVYPIAYIEWLNDGTISNRWINVMNPDGSGQRTIDLDGKVGTIFSISLSPDGNTIAFIAYEAADDPQRNLFTVNVDGSELRKLTDFGDNQYLVMVSWSPDGSQIAMAIGEIVNGNQHVNIYTISRDGTSTQWITGGHEFMWALTWSPDGESLLFTSNKDCSPGFVSCIWKIQIGKTERTLILRTDKDNIIDVDWSPDGTEIVYGTWHGESEYTIRIADADGSNDRPLLDSSKVIYPRWSPSSDRIYFVELLMDDQVVDNQNIYVVDRDGSNTQQLTDGPNNEYMASPPSR